MYINFDHVFCVFFVLKSWEFWNIYEYHFGTIRLSVVMGCFELALIKFVFLCFNFDHFSLLQ